MQLGIGLLTIITILYKQYALKPCLFHTSISNEIITIVDMLLHHY